MKNEVRKDVRRKRPENRCRRKESTYHCVRHVRNPPGLGYGQTRNEVSPRFDEESVQAERGEEEELTTDEVNAQAERMRMQCRVRGRGIEIYMQLDLTPSAFGLPADKDCWKLVEPCSWNLASGKM